MGTPNTASPSVARLVQSRSAALIEELAELRSLAAAEAVAQKLEAGHVASREAKRRFVA